MKSQAESRRVVVLSEYKKTKALKQQAPRKDPSKILDEVSYHILMAARAMTAKN